MARLAENMSDQSIDNLEFLTQAITEAIAHVDFASITLVDADGKVTTLAPTDPLACAADKLQAELREGPCYDAATEDAMFVSEDLARDHRWPQYAPQAAALGVGAQMGLDLHPPGRSRASLNLYSRVPRPFADAVDIAEIFASHASILLGYTTSMTQMHAALGSRKLIGQALGIVMERYQIDEDRAFDFLVRTSRDSNVKLRVIAADMVSGANRRNKR
jgi:hypothetical protein